MSKVPVRLKCTRCDASGVITEYDQRTCPACVGKGWQRSAFGKSERTCRECAGAGIQRLNYVETCTLCAGKGYNIEMREAVSVAAHCVHAPSPAAAALAPRSIFGRQWSSLFNRQTSANR